MEKEVCMKKHKYLWLFAIALVLAAPGLAKDKVVVESKWLAAPIQIDGNTADWSPDDLVMNKSYELGYAFKNDADNLYLLFVFNIKAGQRENRYMSTIDFSGLTLWTNVEGKEKKGYGLKFYPKLVTGDQLIQEIEKQGQALTDQQKKEVKSKPRYTIFACDAVDKKGQAVPGFKTSGAAFRTAKAQSGVIFEYVIPLALLQDPASTIKWDSSQPLKLGFEWGGPTPEMAKNQGAMLGDRSTQTQTGAGSLEAQVSGGYEGGGGGGSRDFDAAERRRALPKKYDFWIDLKIAQKQ